VVLLAAAGLKHRDCRAAWGAPADGAQVAGAGSPSIASMGCSTSLGRGKPRTITDEQVKEVIVKTLENTSRDATHCSTRSIAREVGLTQSAVLRIWRAFGLQPHRQETWKLSKDPQFVVKVRDVVGLYLNPPERAVVLCVDEKSQIQPLDRSAPICRCCPAHRSVRRTTALRAHDDRTFVARRRPLPRPV
jgi:hypothetical protein